MKEIKITNLNVEYNLLGLNSKEFSLLTTALLNQFSKEEKESEGYFYLKDMIDKIEKAQHKIDTI